MERGSTPSLTVIVPVWNGMSVLPQCVEALRRSSLPRDDWELLIVDDASSDGTSEWAGVEADRVLTVDRGPLGPGSARNLGASAARGDVLVFVDADVCVAPDALERIRDVFASDSSVGACFGAYDDHPAEPDFLSQYRNLYHRYVHIQGRGESETFWAGCGAVRAALFTALGGFDTVAYPRPQIEDIELGYRIRDAGYRIVLDPAIQGTHLKKWSFWKMVRTDLFDRGVPWMRLLLGDGPGGARPATLNVGGAEKAKTGLMGLGCAMVLAGLVRLDLRWLWFAAIPLATIVIMNLSVYAWFARLRGWWFALRVIPMNLVYYLVSGLAVATALVLHFAAPRGSPPAPPRPIRTDEPSTGDSTT